MTFDEFVSGYKNESNWKLKDGRLIIDVLTTNFARKVYETIDAVPKPFEDNVNAIIDYLTEIEYVINMAGPILDDVSGDTKSKAVDGHRRKIDLRIVCRNKYIELSHAECTKAPTPCKAVNDRSKYFYDEEAKDSTIFGVQFAGEVRLLLIVINLTNDINYQPIIIT
ncbi:2579_t:CDS:2, partial [Racocetra fulgida]